MTRLKKYICLLLSFLFVSIVPFKSFASVAVTAPAISVTEYVFSLIFDLCGVEMSASSISSIAGEMMNYGDYLRKANRGELGAFWQYEYDMGYPTKSAAAHENYLHYEKMMNQLPYAHWGDMVDITGMYDEVKKWLSSFPAYHTSELVYKQVSSLLNQFVDITKPTGWGDYAFSVASDDGNKRSNFYVSKIRKPSNLILALDPDGYVSPSGSQWVLFYDKDYCKKYHIILTSALIESYCNVDGSSVDVGKSMTDRIYLSPSQIASLPFPVFSSEDAIQSYLDTGIIGSIYNVSAVGLPVENVRPAIQNAMPVTVPTTITLPSSADIAKQLLDQVKASDDVALKAALANAGLAIDWSMDDVAEETAVAGEEGEKVISGKLSDILAKVEAIPSAIDTFFNNKKADEGTVEEDTKRLSLPSSIATKFPFCIPFDLAYLVTSLRSTSEVPRFEIPMKFDYLSFHYDEIFVVDMGQWDTAVQILRLMLDVLFVAGLIAATRNLIRG